MKSSNLTDKEIYRRLEKHRDVLRRYGVKRIGLFGSYVRGNQKKNSDIDFLVEFIRSDFDNFMNLIFFLEDLFGKRVELITDAALSPYIRAYVKKEVKWYEKEFAVS